MFGNVDEESNLPDILLFSNAEDEMNEQKAQDNQFLSQQSSFRPAIKSNQMNAENNSKLLAQLQEQQKLITLQSLIAQSMFSNTFMNIQPTNIIRQLIQPPDIQRPIKIGSSVMNLKEIKGNVKNAYIKKISSLLNINQDDNQKNQDNLLEEESSSMSEGLQKNQIIQSLRKIGVLNTQQDLESLEFRNKRIQQSAKVSRMRKKLYVSLLEKKVVKRCIINQISEQQGLILEQKHGIQKSIGAIKNTLSQNEALNSFIIDHVHLLKQIENFSQEQKEEGISILMDSYQMRFGASGTKRKSFLKFCTQNIGKQLLSGNFFTLLLGSQDMDKTCIQYLQNHQIDKEEFNDFVKTFKEIANIEDENQTYKILSIIHQLINHKKKFQTLINSTNKNHNNLKQDLNKLDSTTCQIYSCLNSNQQAILLNQSEQRGVRDEEFVFVTQTKKIKVEQLPQPE